MVKSNGRIFLACLCVAGAAVSLYGQSASNESIEGMVASNRGDSMSLVSSDSNAAGSAAVSVQPAAAPSHTASFIERYQARVSATQAAQPHWITPLVTVTPRLEQEIRTDFVHQYNPHGFAVWNYGNSKGLELIPERHTEIIFNIPPFFNRSNGEQDGFGDVSFLAKERIFARNEQHGNEIITAFVAGTIPTGKNGNGSCCAVVTPTLAVGKGFGQLDFTSTAGGSLPVTNEKGLGHTITWNNVAQYRLATSGPARFFWPEFEINSSFYKGGATDGKTAVFATPGLIVGRIPLTHDAKGNPGRLGLTLGVGQQIAISQYHSYNHATVITLRLPF